jgi:putative transposase
MGEIAKENNMKALTVGGVKDHAHVFLSLPATISIAKAIQLIKGGSSTWVSKTFPSPKDFNWQEGYGAFTISVASKKNTVAYIKNQIEHHQANTFQEEYLAFLKKHDIEYDDRYIWG